MTVTADETSLAGNRTEHALIWVRLEQLLRQQWFYYGTLFLLQLKRTWGMWQYRDLTSGDTSSYFADAFKWFRFGQTDIVWSPLYECFYGTLLHLSRDVATVTVLHRMLIVFTATLLVLAVVRRLLPMELAWLIGAWWAVMPINFDTMYEVHLFAVIPILVAWLVLLSWRGPWTRGTALAIFIVETILVRNETSVATGLFFLICLFWEWRRLDKASTKTSGRESAGNRSVYTVIAYLIPVTLAAASVAWVYHRSYLKGEEMRRVIRAKHTVNMGQVYAFGYEQRHPEWTDSPWTDYQRLTQRDFGTDEPTLGLMFRRNPKAVVEHFLWNISLVPNGLQLMLFSGAYGSRDPGYGSEGLEQNYPLKLSIVTLAIVLVGGFLIWRNRRWWWTQWIRPRLIAWLAMLAVACVSVFIVLSQRPRPSYLFALTVVLMTVIGLCLFAIIAPVPGLKRLRPLMPGLMIAFVIFTPSAYASKHFDAKPMLITYERLRPYEKFINDPKCVFLKGEFAQEIMNYIGISRGTALDYSPLANVKRGTSLADVLDANHVNLFYLDRDEWLQLEAQQQGIVSKFLATGQKSGWQLIGQGDELPGGRWILCRRVAPDGAGSSFGVISGIPGLENFSGWAVSSGVAAMEGPYPDIKLPIVRWGLGPESTLSLDAEKAGKYTLLLSGLAPVEGQMLDIKLDGVPLGRFPMKAGEFIDMSIPLEVKKPGAELTIHYATWQDATPTIKEAVLYRRLLVRPAE